MICHQSVEDFKCLAWIITEILRHLQKSNYEGDPKESTVHDERVTNGALGRPNYYYHGDSNISALHWIQRVRILTLANFVDSLAGHSC